MSDRLLKGTGRESFFPRRATLDDVSPRSARELGRQDYTPAQIESALESAWGVDTELNRDRTCFVATAGEVIVACGGWSRCKTLFGGDAQPATAWPMC